MQLSYMVDESLAGREIRQLALGPWGFSEKMWKHVKWNGKILVNGSEHHNARLHLKAGDRGDFIWQEKTKAVPVRLPLAVLYEDDRFLIVNKPANMLIHPTHRDSRDTLVHAVSGYLAQRGERAGVHPLYRLDRDTTGVVVIAKSAKVQHDLTRSHDQLYREYLAVIQGRLTDKKGCIAKPLGQDPQHKGRWQVCGNGRPAVTEYEVLQEARDCSLLKVHLLTGRTHQIRVHFASLGHPLLGDRLYGGACALFSRQALHASCISFLHPDTGQSVFCEAPLPEDMRALLHACFT